MSAAEISHAIQSIGFLTDFRESSLMYPVIMSTHLACIALFGGMILMTDLRLLGISLTRVPLADVIDGLRIWKRIGLVVMIFCGLMLALSEMDKYYANTYFQIKMVVLLLAGLQHLAFRKSVYNNAAAIDKMPELPGVAKLCGLTSLIVWIGILCLGRWIAYYEAPGKPDAAQLVGSVRQEMPRQKMPRHAEPGVAVEAVRVQVPAATPGL